MKKDAVCVNTSLGQPFEINFFLDWISQNSGNYVIFDGVGTSDMAEKFRLFPNILVSNYSSGFTEEAKELLTKKSLG